MKNTNVKISNKNELTNVIDQNIIIKKRRKIIKLFCLNNRNNILIINSLNNLFRFYVFVTKQRNIYRTLFINYNI